MVPKLAYYGVIGNANGVDLLRHTKSMYCRWCK
jgi:hypothetical protein